MKQYPFAENRRNQIFFVLFLAAMLYLARDSMVTASILGFVKSQILMLGLMGLAGGVFLVRNRRAWKSILLDCRVGGILLCAAVLLLPMVLKRDWQMMYFSVLLCLCFSIFLTYFTSSEQVAKTYVLLLTAVGLYSMLAAYLLRQLPDRGLLAVPVFRNASDVEFYNFGLSFVSVSFVARRNFGLFREPGVYQYFIMLALFLNNYTVEWKRQKTLWTVNAILALLMLTTFATGGYVELALFALVLFIDKKLYRNKGACLVLISLAAAGLGIFLWAWSRKNMLYWELYGMVVSKIFGGEASSTERVDSILLNLTQFLQNPLLGGKLAQILHAIENNTSSTTLMFAVFGLFGGCLHVAGWVALVWKKERKRWVNLALLVILFMSFNTQNLIADVFFWLLPTMALAETVLPKYKKKV